MFGIPLSGKGASQALAAVRLLDAKGKQRLARNWGDFTMHSPPEPEAYRCGFQRQTSWRRETVMCVLVHIPR